MYTDKISGRFFFFMKTAAYVSLNYGRFRFLCLKFHVARGVFFLLARFYQTRLEINHK